MFAVTLMLAERTRHYSIAPATGRGWEIRIEENSRVRRLDYSDDWHRVERALQRFAQEASALKAAGWLVVEAQSMKR
jgi:hypothetical protein